MPLRRTGRISVTGTSLGISLIGGPRAHRGRAAANDAGWYPARPRAAPRAPQARDSGERRERFEARDRAAPAPPRGGRASPSCRARASTAPRRRSRRRRRGVGVQRGRRRRRSPSARARRAAACPDVSVAARRARARPRRRRPRGVVERTGPLASIVRTAASVRCATMCPARRGPASRREELVGAPAPARADREVEHLEGQPLADQGQRRTERVVVPLRDDDVRARAVRRSSPGRGTGREVGGGPAPDRHPLGERLPVRPGRRTKCRQRPRTTPNRAGTAARSSWSAAVARPPELVRVAVDHPVGAVRRSPRGAPCGSPSPPAGSPRLLADQRTRPPSPVTRARHLRSCRRSSGGP